MSPRAPRQRWLLYAAILVVLGATLLFFVSEGNPALQRTAAGIFVAAAVLYVAARIAMIGRNRTE